MFLLIYQLARRVQQLRIALVMVLALWGGIGPVAAAQSPWKADPVLSQHIINQVVQGQHGFLWISTDNGIYRYDGYQTIALNRILPKSTILPNAAYKIALGKKGDIWLLGAPGLFRYCCSTQHLTTIPLKHPIADYPNYAVMAADTIHNRLWINQGAHQLVALSLDRGSVLPGSTHLFQRQIDWMTCTTAGGVWVVTADHIITHFTPHHAACQYRGPGARRLYPVLNTYPQQFFSACAQYTAQPDGSLRETYRWLPSHFGVFTEESLFLPQVQSGAEQWVFGRYLVRLRRRGDSGQPTGASIEPVEFENSRGYARPPYYQLFLDDLGTEWGFSDLMRGCYKRRGSTSIQVIPSAQGDFYSTRAITRVANGQLVVSSYTSLLRQLAKQPMTPLQRWVPLNTDLFVANDWLALPHRPHQLLVAMENSGIYLLNTQTWQFDPLDLIPTQPLGATDLEQGPKGQVWAGTQSGLFWLDTAQLRVHAYRSAKPTKPLRDIKALAFDKAGYLWLATNHELIRLMTSTGQLLEFDQQQLPRRIPIDELLSLYPNGTRMWVGTRNQGLLLVDPKQGVIRQVTTADGLPSNTVCSLLADKRGDLWLGTYAGIVRYQPATKAIAVFTKDDGLADNECNYQSAFRDTNGDLYFGSVKGVTRIIPQRLLGNHSVRRRLVISRILQYPAGDTVAAVSYPKQGGNHLLSLTDDGQVAVQVALTDYLSPENTRYRYRLLGLADTTWHYFSSQHLIRLSNIPVGDYTLVFQATATNGFASINSLRLPVRVRRTWVKYTGFWAAAGLLAIGAAVAYGYYSRRQQQQQQLLLRQQLAYDLHDELGSLLFRASLQAELLKKGDLTSSVASHLLSDLRAASHAMRDIVWGIDPKTNSVGDLFAHMQEYLDQIAHPTSRRIEMQSAHLQLDKLLPTSVRQNVYAVFKEAVTNSLRHAQRSTLLLVSFTQERQQLVLSIRDDGQPTQLGRLGGIGLRSMRQRAQDIAGQLVITSLPEGGVLVRLSVALQS